MVNGVVYLAVGVSSWEWVLILESAGVVNDVVYLVLFGDY